MTVISIGWILSKCSNYLKYTLEFILPSLFASPPPSLLLLGCSSCFPSCSKLWTLPQTTLLSTSSSVTQSRLTLCLAPHLTKMRWLTKTSNSMHLTSSQGFPAAKSLPAMQEMRVRFLVWENPLEEEMATHSSILAWETPWTEEPGGLQSMGSQKSLIWLSD